MKHSTPFGRARQARPGGAVRGFGKIVAIIERLKIGGTCVNTGCIPTKTTVAIAHTHQRTRTTHPIFIPMGGPKAHG